MIIEKTIKFGYGTVLIGSCSLSKLMTFQHIQPPKPIGDLKDVDLSDVIVLEEVEFEYQSDMRTLRTELDSLPEENLFLEFRGYILDFSNYNEESVNMLRRSLNQVINGWQLGLAC